MFVHFIIIAFVDYIEPDIVLVMAIDNSILADVRAVQVVVPGEEKGVGRARIFQQAQYLIDDLFELFGLKASHESQRILRQV